MTTIQERSRDLFLQHPLCDEVLTTVSAYLRVVLYGRPIPGFGEHIGVTVMPGASTRTLARVNAAVYMLMDVVIREGEAYVRMALPGDDVPGVLDCVERHDGFLVPGFSSAAAGDNSRSVFDDFASARSFLADEEAQVLVVSMYERWTERPLRQANWHNPLVDDLLSHHW